MSTLFKVEADFSINGGSLNGALIFCTMTQPHSLVHRVSSACLFHNWIVCKSIARALYTLAAKDKT